MKRIYQLTLYQEVRLAEEPANNAILAERIAAEIMRALPVNLCEGVRLIAAEAIYRGHRVAAVRPKGAIRRGSAYLPP